MSNKDQTDLSLRSAPNCARCRNHNVHLPVKSHKRFCKFRSCRCNKCMLTAERQKVMARQTAVRRAEEQDLLRVKQGLPLPCSPSLPLHNLQKSNSSKEERDCILLLLRWCNLPTSVTPLLQIVFRQVSSDVQTIYRCFKESQEAQQKTCPIETLRGPTPYSYAACYPPVRSNSYLAYHHEYKLPIPRMLPYLENPILPGDIIALSDSNNENSYFLDVCKQSQLYHIS